jgi:DNA polymerase V
MRNNSRNLLQASIKNMIQGIAKKSSPVIFGKFDRFRTDLPRFSGSRMITLSRPTSCTSPQIKVGLGDLTDLYKPGYAYNKAGIMLTGLSSATMQQQNLFVPSEEILSKVLMQAFDRVNDRWGRDTVRYGSSGLAWEWCMKQEWKSPAYTTSRQDLPVVAA